MAAILHFHQQSVLFLLKGFGQARLDLAKNLRQHFELAVHFEDLLVYVFLDFSCVQVWCHVSTVALLVSLLDHSDVLVSFCKAIHGPEDWMCVWEDRGCYLDGRGFSRGPRFGRFGVGYLSGPGRREGWGEWYPA